MLLLRYEIKQIQNTNVFVYWTELARNPTHVQMWSYFDQRRRAAVLKRGARC